MVIFPTLVRAWHTSWTLRKRHATPWWTRLLVATSLALLVWGVLYLLVLVGILRVEVADPAFKTRLLWGTLLLWMSIAWSMATVLYLAERLLPEAMLARLSPARDWRAAAWMSLLLLSGILLGNLAGSLVLALRYPASEPFFSSALGRQLRFLQFLPFLLVVNGIFWRQRLLRQALRTQAIEAQLRLLHAQIEPHFLFNTLANIESLLDVDLARARAMLEAFSDHLRAGMGQLRVSETTLAAELDMVASYLRLLQIRMGERLRFSIDAQAAARTALLPPLLLQPLVENAIRHGLEPKLEGGCVRIVAGVEDGQLRVRIEDDGLGLDAPRAVRPAGSGTALENIRARLRHRYGDDAALTLTHAAGATTALIDLPFQTLQTLP
jgi:hypothetical protein